MISKKNTSPSWRICRRLTSFAAIFLALFIILSLGPGVRVAFATTMYFYHPDANLRDVAELKSLVQEYFKSIDSKIKLQAFLKRKDLESAMKRKPPDYLLAASWVSKDTGSRLGYKPLAVGQMGAKKSYEKVLISKKALPPGGTPTVSMVGLGGQDIKDVVPNLKKYAHLNVIEVSKDLDAVLAVSFDQVDLGLVKSQNIDAIRSVNALAVKDIKVLGRSSPIEHPIISASPNVGAPDVDKFLQGVLTVKNAKSAKALDLMGFDGWGKV